MAVIRKTKKPQQAPVAKSVEKVLEEVRRAGIQMVPLDIKSVLEFYGINVFFENMEDLSGYVEKRNGAWLIGVNSFHSRRRQRFTMAHELGHLCLHAHLIEGKHREHIFFRSNMTDKMEREANEFASDLLIPKDYLYKKIEAGIRQLSDLADVFDVSLDAMRYKAFQLKLISEY